MKKIDEIKIIIEQNKPLLEKKFGVKELGIFGSYVRGEQAPESDIDVLVEFRNPIGLFEFVALKNHLSGLLNAKVDLIMKTALRPKIGENILQEVLYV